MFTLKLCCHNHSLVGQGPISKAGDLNTIAHNHVFDCEKKPMLDEILTESVLFPCGSEEDNGEFMDALFKIRRLRVLKHQMQGKCIMFFQNARVTNWDRVGSC